MRAPGLTVGRGQHRGVTRGGISLCVIGPWEAHLCSVRGDSGLSSARFKKISVKELQQIDPP